MSTPDIAESRPHEGYDPIVDHTGPAVSPTPAAAADDNVFQVLAARARTRAPLDLWVAVIGGSVDAGLLWWRHPLLSWLAAGCAAVAAYGVWGLLDRAMDRQRAVIKASDADESARGRFAQLSGLRDVVAILGTGGAAWAVLRFMAVALANWNH